MQAIMGDFSASSNINSDELSSEEALKLRGDTIGDTFYKESFVIKTLLHLNDDLPELTEELEEDFCNLWDMTKDEPDVCDYLIERKFPEIAASSVKKYSHLNRLVEMLVGTMANVCLCSTRLRDDPQVFDALHELVDLVANDDALTLIQVMRLVRAIASADLLPLTFLDRELVDRLDFILQNSLNCELLSSTLTVVAAITENKRLDMFVFQIRNKTDTILKPCLEAYDTIFTTELQASENGSPTENQKYAFRYLLQIACNISSYFEEDVECLNEPLKQLQTCSGQFVNELCRSLALFFKTDDFLDTEEFDFFFQAVAFVLPVLEQLYDQRLVSILLEVAKDHLKADSFVDCMEGLLDVVFYFLEMEKDAKEHLLNSNDQKISATLNMIEESPLISDEQRHIINTFLSETN